MSAVGAMWLAFVLRRRRLRDPVEIERQRRERVNRVGRIVEGKILDVVETDAESAAAQTPVPAEARVPAGATAPDKRRWIVYCYSISGVTYETAQDVSALAPGAAPTIGDVASVKYDPANPSSSILAAEGWSGLS